MDRSSTRDKVVDKLVSMAAPIDKRTPISDATEIYYDLGIYGHDLYDLLTWVSKEFGVQFHVDLRDYGPREGMAPLLFRRWRERRERKQKPYKSLTVGDILAAVGAGHWPIQVSQPGHEAQ